MAKYPKKKPKWMKEESKIGVTTFKRGVYDGFDMVLDGRRNKKSLKKHLSDLKSADKYANKYVTRNDSNFRHVMYISGKKQVLSDYLKGKIKIRNGEIVKCWRYPMARLRGRRNNGNESRKTIKKIKGRI